MSAPLDKSQREHYIQHLINDVENWPVGQMIEWAKEHYGSSLENADDETVIELYQSLE